MEPRSRPPAAGAGPRPPRVTPDSRGGQPSPAQPGPARPCPEPAARGCPRGSEEEPGQRLPPARHCSPPPPEAALRASRGAGGSLPPAPSCVRAPRGSGGGGGGDRTSELAGRRRARRHEGQGGSGVPRPQRLLQRLTCPRMRGVDLSRLGENP